ncbi:hypothetical protein CDAR_204041 [Caerostris darwini]|uniref:Uncharacterized protein n=1 Tax=Caerostris darwini TaxID=1538125 RepID=A0AAV4RQG8_9ARAC|nr:hypothetical protein CDAR_204041 [Caerostris darwini]
MPHSWVNSNQTTEKRGILPFQKVVLSEKKAFTSTPVDAHISYTSVLKDLINLQFGLASHKDILKKIPYVLREFSNHEEELKTSYNSVIICPINYKFSLDYLNKISS